MLSGSWSRHDFRSSSSW